MILPIPYEKADGDTADTSFFYWGPHPVLLGWTTVLHQILLNEVQM